MKRKRVVVLGATGSIGDSALKVAHDIPDRLEIVGLAANSQAEKLAQAANKTRACAVCLTDETNLEVLRRALGGKPEIFTGAAGPEVIATMVGADMVLGGKGGTAALPP